MAQMRHLDCNLVGLEKWLRHEVKLIGWDEWVGRDEMDLIGGTGLKYLVAPLVSSPHGGVWLDCKKPWLLSFALQLPSPDQCSDGQQQLSELC